MRYNDGMNRLVIKTFFILILFTSIAIVLLPHLGTPRADRQWAEPYARTSDAIIGSSTVTLTNVRNFNHSDTAVINREWLDEVLIHSNDIEAVWFGLARFKDSRWVGHSFLSFELASGTVYTLSIEARREPDETYSSVKGLFNNFELWYGWGTERDFLGVSLFMLDRPLEYYRLNLTPAEAQAVFRSVALETHQVAAQPQFYNTLTANCTNLLAKAVNEQYPGRVPYHVAWNLPGRAPQFLQKEGLVDNAVNLTELEATARINGDDPALTATIDTTPSDFSLVLREQLQQ